MDTKAAFEKWWKDQCEQLPPKIIAFSAWHASREAIEIELDGDACHSDEYFCDGYRIATEAAEEAITSHGIRIKGKTE
ncbi:hypothetical protein [Rahnella inusitata]|uniref:hypothetical protein n=1 Tax=Rahnella inusitata TaxID=58169 RepID=UPI0039BEC059